MPKLPRPSGKRNIEASPKEKAKLLQVKNVTEDNTSEPVKESVLPKVEDKASEALSAVDEAILQGEEIPPVDDLDVEDIPIVDETPKKVTKKKKPVKKESVQEEPEEDSEELRQEYEDSLKELESLSGSIEVTDPSIKNKRINIQKPLTREEYLNLLKEDILELLKDEKFRESFVKELDLAFDTLDSPRPQQFNKFVDQTELFLVNLAKILESFTQEKDDLKVDMVDSHFQDFPAFSYNLLNKIRPDIDIIDESIMRYLKDNCTSIYKKYVTVKEDEGKSVFSNLLYGGCKHPLPVEYLVSSKLRRLKDPVMIQGKEYIFVSILEGNKITDYRLIPTGSKNLFKEYRKD